MDDQLREDALNVLEGLREEAEKHYGAEYKERRLRLCDWLFGLVAGAGASYPVAEFERNEHDSGMTMPGDEGLWKLPPGKYVVFRAGDEPIATPEVEGE